MATIRARKHADGSMRYTAIVRLRKGTTVIHQEAKTFAHRSAAAKWARTREVVLEDPAALVRAQQGEKTLSQLIRCCQQMVHVARTCPPAIENRSRSFELA